MNGMHAGAVHQNSRERNPTGLREGDSESECAVGSRET